MKIHNWQEIHQKELHDRFEVAKGVPEKVKIGLSTGARLNRIKQREICESKNRFITESEAQQAADEYGKIHTKFTFRCYLCPVCFGWHVTKKK